jgi:hypothetical protein
MGGTPGPAPLRPALYLILAVDARLQALQLQWEREYDPATNAWPLSIRSIAFHRFSTSITDFAIIDRDRFAVACLDLKGHAPLFGGHLTLGLRADGKWLCSLTAGNTLPPIHLSQKLVCDLRSFPPPLARELSVISSHKDEGDKAVALQLITHWSGGDAHRASEWMATAPETTKNGSGTYVGAVVSACSVVVPRGQ